MEDQQSIAEELKKEIEKIRSDYEKARGLLKNAQELSDSLTQLKPLIESDKNDVATNTEQIKNWKKEIEDLRSQSQGFVNDISVNLEKVRGNIVSMQEAYNQFSEIKGKVTGRGEEIEGLVNDARGLKKDIENTKLEAQQTFENIKAAFADVQNKTQEMQTAYEGFLLIKGQIDNTETGLQAVFDIVLGSKTKSELLNKEIQSFRDESKQFLNDIKNNKESSEIFKNDIVGNLKKSKLNVEEVEKITALITDTGFANAFQSRAKKLFWGYVIWGIVFGIGVIVLAGLLIYFFGNLNGSVPAPNYVLYRLALTSPLLFLIAFAVTQYKKERDLNEKYEFKAVSATVVRSHVKFLIDTFGVDNGANIFACDIFAKIYKEPYGEDDDLRKKFGEVESLIKVVRRIEGKEETVDIKKIIDSVKELKTLVSDEDVLKSIVGIFTKK